MAKRKDWLKELVSERYFVWAVVCIVLVGIGVLGQISIAKSEMDTDGISGWSVLMHHVIKPHHR